MGWVENLNAEYSTDEDPDCRTVAAIREKATQNGQRNMASRLIHRMVDQDAITGWKQDLLRILQLFTVRSVDPT